MLVNRLIPSHNMWVTNMEKRLQSKKDCWCLCVCCSRDENIAHGLVKGMGEARIPIAMMMRGDADGNVEMGPLFSLWEIWTRVSRGI